MPGSMTLTPQTARLDRAQRGCDGARGLQEPNGLMEAQPLDVQAFPNPFSTRFERLELPAGLTVAQILEAVQPDPVLLAHAHVYIGRAGVAPDKWAYIPRDNWRLVRPNPGHIVSIRVVPQDSGGGKNPLRTFLMIAVVAVSIVFPYLAPLSYGLTAAAGGLTALGAAVSAGIGIVGSLLINALVPPPRQDLGGLSGLDRSASPTLTGARNQPQPFGVVAGLLGRFKQTPASGARTYTELVGDDQYLRTLVSWGIGLRHFEPFKIGTTLLSEFAGVEAEHRRGWHPDHLTDQGTWDASTGSFPAGPAFGDRWEIATAGTMGGVAFAAGDTIIWHGMDDAVSAAPGWDRNGDLPHTLYTNDAFEEGLAIELPASPGGGARRTVTTQPGTKAWSIDISFLQGLISLQDDGDRRPWTRQFLIERAPAGSGQWQTVKTLTVRAQKAGVLRRGFYHEEAAEGQWDIGITPLPTPASDAGDVFDLATITALRSFSPEAPLNTPGESSTVLRIKATGQLQGVVDELNSITTSVMRDWDSGSGTWVWRPTQWPASHYREICQGIGTAQPLPDDEVDLVALEDWHEKCVAAGWQCNVVVDFETTIDQLLQDVAATGRAARTLRDGKESVVIDEGGKPTIGHFTPRNTANFKGTITYPELPHAFRVPFRNEMADFEQDERLVFMPGYDENNATVFERLSLPAFITHPDLAWRHGRLYGAEAVLRREGFTWDCDIEHIRCQRGDRSVIGHDVLTAGLAYGRIKSLTLDGSNDVTAIEVDEEMTMEAGKDYGLVVRTINDARLSIPLVNAEATVNTVTPVTPVPAAEELAEGDLVTFGELGVEVLDIVIKSIAPADDHNATLAATLYAGGLAGADDGPVPEHVYQGTPTVSILYPVAIAERSDGTVLIRDPDGSWQNRILVGFLRPSGLQTAITGIEARFRDAAADADEAWTTTPAADVQAGEISIMPVEGGIEYQFQLRWVLRDGGRGNWSPAAAHLVVGKEAPPSEVAGFAVQQNGAAISARWDQVPDRDVDGYILRYGQPAVPWMQGDFELTEAASGTQVATFNVPPGTWDIMIKALDTSGNESATEARARITAVSTFDVIEAVAQGPLWPGLRPDAVTVTVSAEDEADWNAGTLENVTVAVDGALELVV